nr:MAG TPA: hypothetical protein [Caudoviricetes sp.]
MMQRWSNVSCVMSYCSFVQVSSVIILDSP